jgi:hypothetical protein
MNAPLITEPGASRRQSGPVYHPTVEQGSEAWAAMRCGVITASEMRLLISPPPKVETRVKKDGEPYKQREWVVVADDDACRTHIYELAAQRLTKFVEPVFETNDMIRGKIDEEEARALYSNRFAPVTECGFITNDKWGFTLGYSPDGLVGAEGQIECKSRRQKYQVQTLIEYVLNDAIPPEYLMQHQTGLLVSERKWVDFVSYSKRLPLAVVRVHPDDAIQSAIIEAAQAAEAKIADIIAKYEETFL